jgi:hypothetical protein
MQTCELIEAIAAVDISYFLQKLSIRFTLVLFLV